MPFPPVDQQMEILLRGCDQVVPEEELVTKLKRSYDKDEPLIIKEGFDPTAPDLHLGHTVLLQRELGIANSERVVLDQHFLILQRCPALVSHLRLLPVADSGRCAGTRGAGGVAGHRTATHGMPANRSLVRKNRLPDRCWRERCCYHENHHTTIHARF